MAHDTRPARALVGVVLFLAVTASQAAVGAHPATGAPGARGRGPDVEVANLSVDGRRDSPAGLDNPRPALAWQMAETGHARAHPCHRPGARRACPGDQQTAYEVQAAATVRDLADGDLIWETGRVAGSEQRVVFGGELGSRDTVAWRVRVWDAGGRPSGWSEPSTWSMGLLEQSDWGDARWIEYPGRTEDQPMPIVARQFRVPRAKRVADARLYLSGVGLHYATVNGEEITDEVLAPGNSNYQLSSEYRTYDVSDDVRRGDNTIAEVWVPNGGGRVDAPSRATLDRVEGDYTVYSVPSGELSFTSPAGRAAGA